MSLLYNSLEIVAHNKAKQDANAFTNLVRATCIPKGLSWPVQRKNKGSMLTNLPGL